MKVSSIWAKSLVAALVLMSVGSMALAADVTGTWTFSAPFGGRRGGGGGGGGGGAGGAGGAAAPARVSTLKLKQDGDKVTGTLQAPAGGRGRRGGAGADPAAPPPAPPAPADISNGKLAGDTLTFEVSRQNQAGDTLVTKYSGKVDGDTITFTIQNPARGGGDPPPPQEGIKATRQKEAAK